MPDYANSKMVKSAEENRQKLADMRNALLERRHRGDVTNYIDKNKNEAKKFSFFRFLITRNDRIGRFGVKKKAERDDVIKDMEENETTDKGAYFDPFSLRIIVPRAINYLGSDSQEALSADRLRAQDIEDAFVERVDENIDEVSENDFEAKRNTLDAQLAFAQNEESTDAKGEHRASIEEYAESYNAGRKFIPDKDIVEEVPDEFQVEIGVDEPPLDNALEWEMYKADQTKSFSAKVKGIFRSMFRVKAPTDKQLFMNFAKTLPEYKRLENEGKQLAQDAGIRYDPKLDNDLNVYVSDLYEKLRVCRNGHSYVSLVASKSGKELSVYSFRFVTLSGTGGGMEGVITGLVDNPIRKNTAHERIATREKITYANYLRAAAKVRGVAGSMRTYSYLGYNCTSFAAEIAESAGVKFAKEDTSAILMSHRHRQQRVDNPFRLASFIKRREEQAREDEESLAHYKESETGKAEESGLDIRKKAFITRYRKRFLDLDVVKIIVKYHLANRIRVERIFDSFIDGLVTQDYRIDERFPIEENDDITINNARIRRENAKIRSFGKRSAAELLDNLVSPQGEDAVCRLIMENRTNMEPFVEKTIDSLPGKDTDFRDELVNELTESDYIKERLPGRDAGQKKKVVNMLLMNVCERQKLYLRRMGAAAKDKEGKELVRAIERELNGADLKYFRRGIYESAQSVLDAVTVLGVPFPADDMEKEPLEAGEEREQGGPDSKPEEKPKQAVQNKRVVAAATYKKAKRDVSNVPERITKTDIRKMFQSDLIMENTRIIAVFVEVYKTSLGIECYSRRSNGPVSSIVDIYEYVAECNRKAPLRKDIRECYIKVCQTESFSEAVQYVRELFESILNKTKKEELISIMSEAMIV
ncbi:MAG: hypothetical protein E7307_14005 [Butyrivibrio sp.]|nr:hypothetical protein [Butyrivibrio sp.]